MGRGLRTLVDAEDRPGHVDELLGKGRYLSRQTDLQIWLLCSDTTRIPKRR